MNLNFQFVKNLKKFFNKENNEENSFAETNNSKPVIKEIKIDYLKDMDWISNKFCWTSKKENAGLMFQTDLVCYVDYIESDDKMYRFYINQNTSIRYKIEEGNFYEVELKIDNFHILISSVNERILSILLMRVNFGSISPPNVETIEKQGFGKQKIKDLNSDVIKAWILSATFIPMVILLFLVLMKSLFGWALDL